MSTAEHSNYDYDANLRFDPACQHPYNGDFYSYPHIVNPNFYEMSQMSLNFSFPSVQKYRLCNCFFSCTHGPYRDTDLFDVSCLTNERYYKLSSKNECIYCSCSYISCNTLSYDIYDHTYYPISYQNVRCISFFNIIDYLYLTKHGNDQTCSYIPLYDVNRFLCHFQIPSVHNASIETSEVFYYLKRNYHSFYQSCSNRFVSRSLFSATTDILSCPYINTSSLKIHCNHAYECNTSKSDCLAYTTKVSAGKPICGDFRCTCTRNSTCISCSSSFVYDIPSVSFSEANCSSSNVSNQSVHYSPVNYSCLPCCWSYVVTSGSSASNDSESSLSINFEDKQPPSEFSTVVSNNATLCPVIENIVHVPCPIVNQSTCSSLVCNDTRPGNDNNSCVQIHNGDSHISCICISNSHNGMLNNTSLTCIKCKELSVFYTRTLSVNPAISYVQDVMESNPNVAVSKHTCYRSISSIYDAKSNFSNNDKAPVSNCMHTCTMYVPSYNPMSCCISHNVALTMTVSSSRQLTQMCTCTTSKDICKYKSSYSYNTCISDRNHSEYINPESSNFSDASRSIDCIPTNTNTTSRLSQQFGSITVFSSNFCNPVANYTLQNLSSNSSDCESTNVSSFIDPSSNDQNNNLDQGDQESMSLSVSRPRQVTVTQPVTCPLQIKNLTSYTDSLTINVPTSVTITKPPPSATNQSLIHKSPTNNSTKDIFTIGKGLNIFHLNIHFLYSKLDEIKVLNSDQKFDILCFCETFLDFSHSNNEISLNDYEMYRRDRGTHGGGLVIYVKNNYHCNRRTDLESASIECIWLEIKQHHCKPLLLCYTYRPPSCNVSWLTEFSDSMEKCFSEQKECIILGDFNFDALKPVGSSRVWFDLMESLNFTQLVDKPTRVTLNSSTLIDHAFSNSPDNISSVSVPCYSLSDHYPICITRSYQKSSERNPVHKYISFRKIENFNENDFITQLSLQPWSNINSFNNPSHAITFFNETFISVLNTHAPLKKKRVKKNHQPDWINDEILNAIKTRNQYHRLKDTTNYKNWRNKVKNLIFNSKRDFFNKTVNSQIRNPKKLWAGMKEITGLKSNSATSHILNDDGELIKDPYITANKFNDHFCSIHRTATDGIESVSDIHFNRIKHQNQGKLKNQHFNIPFITCDFVYKQLVHLDASKSTGSDNLSPRYLKIAAPVIAPVLTQIFNLSISNSVFPNSFKTARVIPIHKKGQKSDHSNYRPISILPIVSLILERHVNIHLKDYLESNSLLYQRQSGFRQNHSCQTALLKIMDDWLDALNNNKISGSLFLDFSKAFDLVDHKILIQKLKLYNIDESWFSSYLSNRFQQTHYSGAISNKREVISGVPQGSVLGPTLFLIYVNDLPLSLTETTADIFADDTKIGTSSHSLDILTNALSTDLLNVQSWCNSNNMSLNISKTKLMYISSLRKQPVITNDKSAIILDGNNITHSSVEKLLGINICNTLCWDKQIKQILKTCNSYLFLLSRICIFLSLSNRQLFYNTYILPHLDYCCIIWGNCNQSLEDKIVKFQKRAARLILDITDFNTSSEFLFSELKWQSFPERVTYQKAIMMYKIINKICPDYLLNHITLTSEISTRHTRSHDTYQLYVPKPNCELFRRSFMYSGAVIWNNLPVHVKNAPSVSCFKSRFLRWKYQSHD